MFGDNQILLNILDVAQVDVVKGVLLGVYHALLQSEVGFGPGYRGGGGADALPEFQTVGVLHNPNLQTLEVLQGVDGPVGGDIPEGGRLHEAAQQIELAVAIGILHQGVIVALVQSLVNLSGGHAVEHKGHIQRGKSRNEGQ